MLQIVFVLTLFSHLVQNPDFRLGYFQIATVAEYQIDVMDMFCQMNNDRLLFESRHQTSKNSFYFNISLILKHCFYIATQM